MSHIHFKSGEGFSHHFILPLLVMIGIACIGVYTITQSRAAVNLCKKTNVRLDSGSKCAKYAKILLDSSTSNYTIRARVQSYRANSQSSSKNNIIDTTDWKKLCSPSYSLKEARDAQSAACGLVKVNNYSTFRELLGCGLMEGSASDGTYIYSSCISNKAVNDDHLIVTIYKTSLDTKQVVASKRFDRETVKGTNADIGHANDMAYNSRTNQLVVSAWNSDKDKSRNRLLILNPDTLEVVAKKSLTNHKNANSGSLCYDSSRNEYVAHGAVYNAKFKYVRTLYTEKQVIKDLGMSKIHPVDQGVECTSSRVYVMYVTDQKFYGRIAAYDWKGKLVTKYQFNIGAEPEGMSIAGTAVYVGVNRGGTLRKYSEANGLKYPGSNNDYFIKIDGIDL